MSVSMSSTTPPRLLSDDDHFNVLTEGDTRAIGRLYFGIDSTKIYCRPGCPARGALRKNVRYYYTPESAERAGFRACKRCHPRAIAQHRAMALVDAVRAEVDRHRVGDLTSVAIADRLGQSARELDVAMTAMLGVTTGEFITARSAANQAARAQAAVVGTYASDAPVHYAFAETSLGCLLVAATSVGLRLASLGSDQGSLVHELESLVPAADLQPHDQDVQDHVARIQRWLESGASLRGAPLDLAGTAFQWRVWQALCDIPPGETRTYQEVAAAIGRPTAARAVATACGSNQVALVIPCHRVVRGDGGLGGYRWGVERKAELLRREHNWTFPTGYGR
jgi:AraC family transcriptional regulator, regulatory protein of adaptative response / methylated-DNA-[protein]-cysteine methyltransferase